MFFFSDFILSQQSGEKRVYLSPSEPLVKADPALSKWCFFKFVLTQTIYFWWVLDKTINNFPDFILVNQTRPFPPYLWISFYRSVTFTHWCTRFLSKLVALPLARDTLVNFMCRLSSTSMSNWYLNNGTRLLGENISAYTFNKNLYCYRIQILELWKITVGVLFLS